MLNLIRNTVSNFRTTQATQDSNSFLAAAGITGQVQSQAIYNLVNDLQASGLWSKMKAVYPMVTDNRNIYSYTEDLTNAYWGKNNLTLTQNVANPFGANTAYLMTENSSSGYHVMYSGVVATTALSTYSCYLKSNGRQWAWLSDNAGGVYFDLVNGVVGTASGGRTGSITNIGNGWYRCVVSNNAISGGNQYYISLSLNGADSGNYTGNGTSGIYVYGNQLELGSTASTYQPILTTPSAFMASQMKYNLKDARDLDAAFRLTWSGGWTYSATGATPNGTNAFADTRFNLLTNLPGYDNSFSVYFRQNLYGIYKVGASGSSFDRGMSAHLGWTNSSGTLYHDNLGRNTMANSAYGTFDAYHISSVTSTSSQKLYRNGVMKLSGAATSGLTQPSINFYFGASNDNGTANYFDPKQIAFGTLSTSLTDQDAQLLNQIVEKYQVALSRGVQAAQSFYYNSAYSNEANTYLYSTQITGTTQVSAINTLINGLKANNLWTKMKAVYPFITDKSLQADMAAQMKFNLVNPQDTDAAFRLAFSGGWTYSTNGAQPNGTNGYADTKFSPSANLTLNSSHLSIYSRTSIGNLPQSDMGSYSSSTTDAFTIAIAYNNICYMGSYAFNAAVNFIDFANTDSKGYYVNSRTSSNLLKGFKNNAIGDTSTTSVNGVLPSINTIIGAESLNGTPTGYSTKQYAFATMGNGLTDAEAALLYSLVQQYQTDLSRQV